jgi:glycerol-3-phosphate acyltransferase PlsX
MAIRIVLDAMGGDRDVPEMNVEGALRALRDLDGLHVTLTGPADRIRDYLNGRHAARFSDVMNRLSVVDAPEIVEMDDHPSKVIRSKSGSSMGVGVKLVKQGDGDAFVSAGNSGAVMAFALFHIGTAAGISRPAIATEFPTLRGRCVIVDAGANVDCKPEMLVEFAFMGEAYYRALHGTPRPRIGMLSIGEEDSKGNAQSLTAFALIKQTDVNFVGNVDGKDIPLGLADVVVCDGFVGNVVLKFGEGVATMLIQLIKEALKRHLVAWAALPFVWAAMKDLRKRIDFAEYGGAPLLGLAKPCLICHGRSNAKAIKNALKTAYTLVHSNVTASVVEHLRTGG